MTQSSRCEGCPGAHRPLPISEAADPCRDAVREAPAQVTPPGGEHPARQGDLRLRILRCGARALTEAETLELLLARSAPASAAGLAPVLLARFGGLARVMGATIAELRRVTGESVAVELHVLHEACRRLLEFPILKRSVLSSVTAVGAYLRLSLAGQTRESFRVLYLDKANQLIEDALMGDGTVDHAPVYPREVMRRGLELSAAACCLVHNHPTGSASPSGADIEITRRVVAAGVVIGIPVHDHFLVAGEEVVSFRALGLIG
jgi:DNA repair protein RadC